MPKFSLPSRVGKFPSDGAPRKMGLICGVPCWWWNWASRFQLHPDGPRCGVVDVGDVEVVQELLRHDRNRAGRDAPAAYRRGRRRACCRRRNPRPCEVFTSNGVSSPHRLCPRRRAVAASSPGRARRFCFYRIWQGPPGWEPKRRQPVHITGTAGRSRATSRDGDRKLAACGFALVMLG